MWIAVTPRFRQFVGALQLDSDEIDHGLRRANGVIRCLNRAYFGDSESGLGCHFVGSWRKNTAVTPSGDIDLYYLIPLSEFQRFNNYMGNGQSELLQSVRRHLLQTYPQTEVSGDGQVVVIAFNDLPQIEVAPSAMKPDGTFILPDSHNGGSWITADPVEEVAALDRGDADGNKNLRPLVQMLKCWRRYCDAPIKSFHLELLATEFLRNWKYKLQSFYYYDWMIRDFFEFLVQRANGRVYAPGTYEEMNIGNAWLGKAKSALKSAHSACNYEYSDYVKLAGYEWRDIFGRVIPVDP